MKRLTVHRIVAIVFGLAVPLAPCDGASGQIVDNPGFKALPRPIRYDTPLASKDGVRAVIVYGRNAPWTRTSAEAVQKAVLDWSGVKLELADDRTVTSDETWLLTDAYRKTPLIVVGNAQDNRVIHAMGTRYLSFGNRSWPGGDRFIIRSVFEPFVADVNYIVLEASNETGMAGATAKFAGLLKALPKSPTASVGLIHELGGGKDAWGPEAMSWTPPAEYGEAGNRDATAIAAAFKGKPALPGEEWMDAPSRMAWVGFCGGFYGQDAANNPRACTLSPAQKRIAAAMYLVGGRAVGGRTHAPPNHYGALMSFLGMRGILQTGILDEKEVNEFENFIVLSAAHPNEYWYDNIGSDSGFINEMGDRHAGACLLVTVHLLDYALGHCRLDEKTRKEIERRAEGARKTTAHYVRSFRDNFDTWELGETTMLYFYAMLHQGMPQWIANGNLRRAADCYIMTSDNIPDRWGIPGCYAGLDSYIGSGPGMLNSGWHGRGLVTAAAFYHDDPQYRGFSRNANGVVQGCHGSVGGPFMPMHWESVGKAVEPSMYNGVRSLPFDERMYDLATNPRKEARWVPNRLAVPAPLENLVDRVAFRDGMKPDDAYLFLATSGTLNGSDGINSFQNNSIARYTDLGEIWLYTNTKNFTGWAKSMVSISNGKPYRPFASCTLEAISNLGDISVVASRDHGVDGTDWTRTIVHPRGHYFVVLDRIEALADDEYNLTCRWRTVQPAGMEKQAWVARAPSGSSMRVQTTDNLRQAAEHWESDGAARPFILSQYKRTRLAKGQSQTFQNLLYVSGSQRPDEFEARRVGEGAMIVTGKTAAGNHLALIGTGGGIPLSGFQTDAAVYYVTGNTLHLVGLKTLKVKAKDEMRDVFQADRPVNLMLDCQSGKGQVEVNGQTPVRMKAGASGAVVAQQPGIAAIAVGDAQAIPQPAGLLEAIWKDAKDPSALPPEKSAGGPNPFDAVSCDQPLTRPIRRLSGFKVSSVPAAMQNIKELADGQYTTFLPCNTPYWNSTKDLEITLTFPEPAAVGCLRVVGIMRDGLGDREKNYGQPWNEGDDFTFSLVLSDDGFQKDIRRIEPAKVRFENTPIFGALYYALSRLPTWRLEVGQTAKQIKILPRAAKKDKPELCLTEIEAYAAQAGPDLKVNAFAADLDGDGANELAVGTSNQELAVYRSDGKRLWTRNTYPHDIYTMACDDMDDDGKSEILVYTTREMLHRFNGDGSERAPAADLYDAQLKNPNVRYARTGGIGAMAAWRPDPKRTKEVALFAQGTFFARDDGAVTFTNTYGEPRGAARIRDLFPNEPEAMAAVNASCIVWSARKDGTGLYAKLGNLPMAGPGGAACSRSFGWVQPISAGSHKGILAANEGGMNWFPVAAFLPESKEKGWGFDTGGVPVVAAMAADMNADGAPEALLARKDGFVNVCKLADGSSLALLNTGEPIVGMAVLKDKDGKARLVVGTKFSVCLFGPDWALIGRHPLTTLAAGFAGPGGKDRDRVYVLDATGRVTVLVLK